MYNRISRHHIRTAGVLCTLGALLAIATGIAIDRVEAQQAASRYSAEAAMLNDSGASADVTATMDGQSITVVIEADGLAPGVPHALHFHIGGTNQCPDMSLDADGDGLVNVAEGAPAYGGVRVSLTTEGDVSADSALAVDRFPVAADDGSVSYSRTFDLPADVTATDVAISVVVLHGVDLDGDGQYGGDAPSSLDPNLPLEATIPAACGKLMASGATTMQPPSTGDAGLAAETEGTSLLFYGAIAAAIGAASLSALMLASRARNR